MSSIDTYLNYPWVLFADPKTKRKADCFGIAAHFLYEEMKIDIRDFESVESRLKRGSVHPFEVVRIMTERYKKYLVEFTQVTTPERGDLVVWRQSNLVKHLGVYVGEEGILTSYTGPGSCLVDPMGQDVEYWRHISLMDTSSVTQ